MRKIRKVIPKYVVLYLDLDLDPARRYYVRPSVRPSEIAIFTIENFLMESFLFGTSRKSKYFYF